MALVAAPRITTAFAVNTGIAFLVIAVATSAATGLTVIGAAACVLAGLVVIFALAVAAAAYGVAQVIRDFPDEGIGGPE